METKTCILNGKKIGLYDFDLKDGDIVKIIRVRPRRKKYINKNNKNLFIVKKKASDFFIQDDATYYNMDLFVSEVFPVMINNFISKYENTFEIKEEGKKILKSLNELKQFLEEYRKLNGDLIDESCIDKIMEEKEKMAKKSKKVWGKFGEIFSHLWL